MQIKGTELFVNALLSENVDTLFAYPGGYVLSIFDELYKQKNINIILPRHEQALVHAADGYARSTGKVGVCLVTSGPGATNIVTGVATANYDAVPLVCFAGQVPTHLIGKDSFQEVDIVDITKSICKYGFSVKNRADLGVIIKEAFAIAKAGKPGPVIVELPADIMNSLGNDAYPNAVNLEQYTLELNIAEKQLMKLINLLQKAEKPLFLAGGGINISNANSEFKSLVEKTNIPVVTTIMGKGSLPTSHELYIGNIGMHGSYAANNAVYECDLLISIGTRFNDRITSGLNNFAPNAQIVHIDIDKKCISKNTKADISIVADAKQAIIKLLPIAPPLNTYNWLTEINQWEQSYPLSAPKTKGLSPVKIIQEINKAFTDAIIVTDVGQHQMWTAQFIELNEHKKFLTSGGLGTMGYGFPAAIGAQIGNKNRKVVCISGDGGIQMNIQELATAVLEKLPIIILIFNNGYLGMVRQWQQLFYNKRYSYTNLQAKRELNINEMSYVPDFVRLAESYGAMGIRVFDEDEIENVFNIAEKQQGPVIIEFLIEQETNVFPMVKSGNSLNEMIFDDIN